MTESEPNDSRRGKLALAMRVGLPAIVFAYAFILLFVPLADPDLFWHLKAGQWTLQTGELPGNGDPFSFTSPQTLPEGRVEGLRSQWLGQVAMYGVYAAGGYPGLVVFRSLLILLPLLIVYLLALRRGLSPVWALPLVTLPVLLIALSLQYTFERPQAFTIVFSFALLPLLERLRGKKEGKLPWAALLVILMALWSNLHGGFIFGAVMIAVYSLGVLAEASVRRDRAALSFFIPAAAGVAATGLNPNAYSLLYDFLRAHISRFIGGPPVVENLPGKVDVVGQLMEYKPLWFFYEKLHLIWPLFIIMFMALAGLIIIGGYATKRRINIPAALVAVVIAVFSFYYSRGAMLSLVVLPLVAVGAARDMGKLWRIITAAAAAAMCAVLVFITVQRSPWQLRPEVPPPSWVDAAYPEGAVRFIQHSGLEGPMFNEFRWGGYLIWRLHPGHKVFIDGRITSDRVMEAHMSIVRARPGAVEQLEAFGINFILLQPISRETGVIPPLILKFLEEKPREWSLVYMGGNSALFVRNVPRNGEIIKRYGLPYEALNAPIYSEAERLLRMIPGNSNALLSMAIALTGLQRYDDAGTILRTLPPSPVRDKYLRKVQSRGN